MLEGMFSIYFCVGKRRYDPDHEFVVYVV